MTVELELKETNQALVFKNVENTYQKGKMYCILVLEKGKEVVHRFPIRNIWRSKEYSFDYKSFRGGPVSNTNKK